MTITAPFSERLSEQWLLERTYHAQLRNGRELSVPDLTEAMSQLTDFYVPLSTQSWKSTLAERLPLKKSSNCYVPLSTWREISPEEAHATSQQGIPVLLYGEHEWENPQGASGTDYAICYLDPQRGTFSNPAWRAWFSSDLATLLDGSAHRTITFLGPCMQFPSTTHYTVIAADGRVHEYADRAEAIQGFQTLPPQEVSTGSQVQTVFPQFCYYDEVECPSGAYRIEFFGPRMDKQGYKVKKEWLA
jgi:hypothetical protein